MTITRLHKSLQGFVDFLVITMKSGGGAVGVGSLPPAVVTSITALGPSPAKLYGFTIKEYVVPDSNEVTV